MEMLTLGDRVRYVQNKAGGSANLEKLTGATPSQQSKIIRNQVKSPGIQLMADVAKAGGVSLDWLATGEGEPGNGKSASGYVALPFVGWEGKPPFLFEKNYLVNVLQVPKANALMYHETSDAMEPVIKRDSYVVVNSGLIVGDGLYLMRLNGNETLGIRYVQNNPATGGITVSAGNSRYQPYNVSLTDIQIIGLVTWFGTR